MEREMSEKVETVRQMSESVRTEAMGLVHQLEELVSRNPKVAEGDERPQHPNVFEEIIEILNDSRYAIETARKYVDNDIKAKVL